MSIDKECNFICGLKGIIKAIIEPVEPVSVKKEDNFKKAQRFRNFEFNYNDRVSINLSDTKKISAVMVAVIGETGAGKTQLIKKIIRSGVSTSVKMFIIDNKGDYINKYGENSDMFATDNGFEVCNVLKQNIGFNPLVRNENETNMIVAYKFISIVKNLYPLLGGDQKTNLKNALIAYLNMCESNGEVPNINGMMDNFQENELKGAYMELLEPLVDFDIFTEENISFKHWTENVEKGYILDTKSMYAIDNSVFMFISYAFLEFLSRDILDGCSSDVHGSFKEIKNCLVIDEASDLMEKKSKALDDLLKKAREVGFGVIFGTQNRDQFKTSSKNYDYYNKFVLKFLGSTEKEKLPRDNFKINLFNDDMVENIPYYKTKGGYDA